MTPLKLIRFPPSSISRLTVQVAIYDVEWDGNPAVLMQEQTETYFHTLRLKRREIIERASVHPNGATISSNREVSICFPSFSAICYIALYTV